MAKIFVESARCQMPTWLDRGTHAASTYDSIIPTRLSYNDNSREKASSNRKDAEDRTNRHGRDDRLIGGVA